MAGEEVGGRLQSYARTHNAIIILLRPPEELGGPPIGPRIKFVDRVLFMAFGELVFDMPAAHDDPLIQRVCRMISSPPRGRSELHARLDLIASAGDAVSYAGGVAADPKLVGSEVVPEWPAPWYVSIWVMTRYRFLDYMRSKKSVLALLVVNSVLYLLLSFIFFQLPYDRSGLEDRISLLYFLGINILFSYSLSALVSFNQFRHRLRVERWIGLWHGPSLVLAEFLASLPIRLLVVTVMGTAAYYITGLRTDGFQHYIVFMADLLLLTMASLAFGIMVSAAVERLAYGQVVLPFLIIVMFIYGNLSTSLEATWILRWLQYLSPLYYSLQCLAQNELADLTADTNAFLRNGGYDSLPIAACLPALAGFVLLYLILASIAIHIGLAVIKAR